MFTKKVLVQDNVVVGTVTAYQAGVTINPPPPGVSEHHVEADHAVAVGWTFSDKDGDALFAPPKLERPKAEPKPK